MFTANMTATVTVDKGTDEFVRAMISEVPNVDCETSEAIKSKSPHFMSPTFSSSRQSIAKFAKEQDRTSTPSAPTSTHTKRSQWIASAAKRVGLGRLSDGAPRSRKEGMLPKTVVFSNGVCASFRGNFNL